MKHPPAPLLLLGSRWRSAMRCECVLRSVERSTAKGFLRSSRIGSSAGRGDWDAVALHSGMLSMHRGHGASTVATSRVLALTCQIESRSCCSLPHGGAI